MTNSAVSNSALHETSVTNIQFVAAFRTSNNAYSFRWFDAPVWAIAVAVIMKIYVWFSALASHGLFSFVGWHGPPVELFERRKREGFFNIPVVMQPLIDNGSADSEKLAKFSNRSCLSEHSVKDCSALVALLLAARFPSAIIFAVWSIVVASSNRSVRWSLPHIFSEVCETLPSITYRYAASAVILVVLVCLTCASTSHGLPRSPSWGGVFPVSVSRSNEWFPFRPDTFEASAGFLNPSLQQAISSREPFATMALTERISNHDILFTSRFPSPPSGWRIFEHGNSLKKLSNDGFFGRHNDQLNRLSLCSALSARRNRRSMRIIYHQH